MPTIAWFYGIAIQRLWMFSAFGRWTAIGYGFVSPTDARGCTIWRT
jgi:hypothetical protein